MVSAAVLGTTVSSVQAEGRFGHTIPGGDLEDVIARAQAMTPPADKKWIEVSGQVTAQPLTPNTPQWWAAKELEYNQWKMGYRVLANSGAFVIAPPPVATVEHFQKEVSKDTTYRNYIDKMEFYTQYRELGTFYLSGHYDGSVGSAVPFATLIANENQVVTFHRTTDPLDWNILYNTLKRITPDADAVYQEIYRQTYSDNPTFQDWNTWVPVGNETCVATALCRHYANLQFFIKAKDLNPGADGSEIAENSCALDTRYERFVWE